jgi:hypothetical protein
MLVQHKLAWILAQGANWAVAVTQAFFENGQQRFVILRDWRPTQRALLSFSSSARMFNLP